MATDYSQFSDAELEALAKGQALKVMSDAELEAIAKGAQPQGESVGWSVARGIARETGLNARAAQQGVVGGVLGLPALVGDSVAGVGRDIAYGGKWLAGKMGIAEPPDPKNYGYGEGSAFPLMEKAAAAGRVLPDALGLPVPETTREKITGGLVEGATGAATSGGIGGVIAKGPGLVGATGRFLAADPVVNVVSGAAGGGAGEAARAAGLNDTAAGALGFGAGALGGFGVSGARALAGRSAPVTEAGQRAIAGEALRTWARDPDSALARIEGAPGRTRTPGFVHFMSDAAQDPGIASKSPALRDWANAHDNGGAAALLERRNEALSRNFDIHGAAPGQYRETGALASAHAEQNIRNLNLGSLDPVDVTDMVARMNRLSSPRTQGTREATNAAAADVRQRILAASDIVRDAEGNPIRVEINPERLYAIRRDVSNPPNLDANKTAPTKLEERFTRGVLDDMDARLHVATDGEYSRYMTESRSIRNARDQQEFMSDLADSASTDTRTVTGARQFNPGNIVSRLKDLKRDKPVGGGNKRMSIDRMTEMDNAGFMRRSFLEGVGADMTDANYTAQQGMRGGAGSNTVPKLALEKQIDEAVATRMSPLHRFGEKVIGPATGAAGRMLGLPSLAREANGATVNRFRMTRDTSAEGVKRLLGRAETDLGTAADLIRTPALPPGYTLPELTALSGLQMGVGTTQGGVQGFLAARRRDRGARYGK